ncbi:cation/H(+) antiporter 15-like isoform X2 [Vitis riparia]|nr:cation/H(+) antiporter 15-like isoform X2 [Vitis riparia]
MPTVDAISLGLIMNAQGVLGLGLFKMLKKVKAIDHESFVVMCTSMLVVAGSITPIIKYLYDPSRRYLSYKRTVMHSKPNSELRVLVCMHDEENVHTTINLLQALYPTKWSPMAIYVLHLVELVGRAKPLLIPHKLTRKSSSKATMSQRIVNAFRFSEESNHRVASVQPFTAISPYASMHNEVCAIALDRKISLIIVPFNRRFNANGGLELFKKAVRTMNNVVRDKAPCSVAILVDRASSAAQAQGM